MESGGKVQMQTVVITGGNSGLGYECAKAIAKAGGWHVILACRNPMSAAQAAQKITDAAGSREVEAMQLDLAALGSVRRFAAEYAARERAPLKALVLNAGVQIVSGVNYTVDGIETTFAVNHLAHFLLANLMLPRLVPPARIVFVSSGTHDPDQRTGMPKPQFRDAHALAKGENEVASGKESVGTAGRRAYTNSKLCNVLCAYEMARRLQAKSDGERPPITVNAFDPGLMPTNLVREYPRVIRALSAILIPALTLVMKNAHSAAESGRALARLVIDPQLEGVTGKYFEGLKEIPSSKDSYDVGKAAELWETSAGLVKLGSGDTIG